MAEAKEIAVATKARPGVLMLLSFTDEQANKLGASSTLGLHPACEDEWRDVFEVVSGGMFTKQSVLKMFFNNSRAYTSCMVRYEGLDTLVHVHIISVPPSDERDLKHAVEEARNGDPMKLLVQVNQATTGVLGIYELTLEQQNALVASGKIPEKCPLMLAPDCAGAWKELFLAAGKNANVDAILGTFVNYAERALTYQEEVPGVPGLATKHVFLFSVNGRTALSRELLGK